MKVKNIATKKKKLEINFNRKWSCRLKELNSGALQVLHRWTNSCVYCRCFFFFFYEAHRSKLKQEALFLKLSNFSWQESRWWIRYLCLTQQVSLYETGPQSVPVYYAETWVLISVKYGKLSGYEARHITWVLNRSTTLASGKRANCLTTRSIPDSKVMNQ